MPCKICSGKRLALDVASYLLPLMLQERIASVLDECCLTDEELRAGPSAWEAWACPWDTLLP